MLDLQLMPFVDCTMTNPYFFSGSFCLHSVSDGEIWENRKFDRCADGICNSTIIEMCDDMIRISHGFR